jgi:hypothetical protein
MTMGAALRELAQIGANTGELTDTPASAYQEAFTVQVADSIGASVTQPRLLP